MTATPFVLTAPSRVRSLRVPAFVAVGAILAAAVLAYVGTNLYASLGQRDLRAQLDMEMTRWASLDPLERSSLAYATGDPVARLVVPEAGVDVVVAEGASPAVMRRGPGHLEGSVTPGAEGVSIVAGNRLGFGSFFFRLGSIRVGDRIVTTSALGRTTFTVTEVRTVPAAALDLSTDSTARVLVLFGSAKLWGGPDRIVVRAVADGEPRA